MVDRFRRNAVEQAYLQALIHLPETLVPSPEEQMALMEIILQLDQLLNGLKPVIRTVFLLSKLEGQTYREISSTLGIPLRTIESHMAVALRHVLSMKLS
jgi:RNA polymerase sigma-19 factor, ECF subfamily